MASFKKMKPAEFAAIFNDMVTIYTNNKGELDLTVDEVSAFDTAKSALNDDILDFQIKKDAFDAAAAKLKQSHLTAAEMAESRNKVIKADKAISIPLKASLGINVDTSNAVSSPLVPPSELVVVGFDNGINKLSWKRNGNARWTQFLIEFRTGETGAWQVLDAVTATRYEHAGQTPGIKVYYRVYAKRSNQKSGNSNVAVAYGQN